MSGSTASHPPKAANKGRNRWGASPAHSSSGPDPLRTRLRCPRVERRPTTARGLAGRKIYRRGAGRRVLVQSAGENYLLDAGESHTRALSGRFSQEPGRCNFGQHRCQQPDADRMGIPGRVRRFRGLYPLPLRRPQRDRYLLALPCIVVLATRARRWSSRAGMQMEWGDTRVDVIVPLTHRLFSKCYA
jgi:hypothetical protein